MCCSRFIGETLILLSSCVVALDKSVVVAVATIYQEQFVVLPDYEHPHEPLDKSRFAFECILAGNFQAFTRAADFQGVVTLIHTLLTAKTRHPVPVYVY